MKTAQHPQRGAAKEKPRNLERSIIRKKTMSKSQSSVRVFEYATDTRLRLAVMAMAGLATMLVVYLMVAIAHAEKQVGLGPEIGTKIPHNLAVDAQAPFEDMAGEKGAVLVFVRSVSWCPFCKKQIIELDMARPDFTALGAELIYVSYDQAEQQAQFAAQKQLNGKFVSDPESQIIDAFGIRNENHEAGSFGYGIPHPIIFVLDADGVILQKIYEEDYAENQKSYASRPAVEIVLDTVQAAFDTALTGTPAEIPP